LGELPLLLLLSWLHYTAADADAGGGARALVQTY
jgi:hypothetical protein